MDLQDQGYLRGVAVRHLLGNIGTTKFYNDIKSGMIPPPVKFGRVSLWRVSDVKALLSRISNGQMAN